jgi:molecular chaperone DnaJ
MAKRDFYETLGVERGASKDELKRAYRRLAMQFHPDRNPGDQDAERKFKEINEAYDILKDDQKRAAYDSYGPSAFENGGFGGGAQDFNFATSFADIFDEMFGDFMGGRRQAQSGQSRGGDIRHNLEISLEDAFRGVTKPVRVSGSAACGECQGTGAEGGARPVTCPTCNGIGRVRAQQGFFTIERTCHSCHGSGKIIKDPCRACGGSGRTHREKSLQVNIPAGVEDGTRIRLAGEGEAGLRGAPAGDLYIFLSVKPHRFFIREGADLHCRVPIPFSTAALGGSIDMPTIDGNRERLAIPAGIQSGQRLKLAGKGMSVLRQSNRGDLLVEIFVETPVNLTKRQQELLREFVSLDQRGTTSPDSTSFFRRAREFWEGVRE